MAKPKIPNQRNKYRELNKRLARYLALVQMLYEDSAKEASQIAISSGYEGEGEFHFDSDVISKRRFSELQNNFASSLTGIINSGTSAEWKESNLVQDLLADKVLAFYDVEKSDGTRYRKYYETNSDALKAFQRRKIGGMNLSQKIWQQSKEYKTALEEAISVGVQKGMSAVTLSKRVSQYLQDFDKLRADYTDKFGKKALAKDCEYKSMRLARSEINMAYRTAEQTRWRQMDFIVGYEIKLSGKHPAHDICDELKGKYPKDFVWTGWHPNDMCYVVPILNTEEEFWAVDETKSVNEVTDVPEAYKDWVADNQERIEIATKRGTLPYFLRDNKVYSGITTKKHPIGLNKIISDAEKVEIIPSSVDIPMPKLDFSDKESLSIEDIEYALLANKNYTSNLAFKNGKVYYPQRAKLQDSIIERYIGDNHSHSDTIRMLGGAPANGKSTLVDSGKLNLPEGSLVVDSDKVKSMMPEYRLMTNSKDAELVKKAANFVHIESSDISKKIRDIAFEKDLSVVIDGVNDGSFDEVADKVASMKAKTGKRVRIDYVTLDTDLSLKLAQIRAEKTGRHVPEKYIRDCNREIPRIVPKLIENSTFDELYLWDTNENGVARLILKFVDGKLDIVDQTLYDRFLEKGK